MSVLHHHHLLERQKGEGGRGGWLVATALCPALGRHVAAQTEESSPGGFSPPLSIREHQLWFITGLPLTKNLPMSDSCFRQLAVLGAEEILWQGFSRL